MALSIVCNTGHRIAVDELPGGRFLARCTTHHTQALTPEYSAADAARRFACDPTGQRFIVCASFADEPRTTDLGGLRQMMRSAIEDGEDQLLCFRWTTEAPHLEPLSITCTGSSGYDDHDYAHPRYAITTAGGDYIAEFTCRIDGRG